MNHFYHPLVVFRIIESILRVMKNILPLGEMGGKEDKIKIHLNNWGWSVKHKDGRKVLDSEYIWDSESKVFTGLTNGLIIDFRYMYGVTVVVLDHCQVTVGPESFVRAGFMSLIVANNRSTVRVGGGSEIYVGSSSTVDAGSDSKVLCGTNSVIRGDGGQSGYKVMYGSVVKNDLIDLVKNEQSRRGHF